jgi:hypothetical protein
MPIHLSELDSVIEGAVQKPTIPTAESILDISIDTRRYQRGPYSLRVMANGESGEILGASISNGVYGAGRRTSTMFFNGDQTRFANYVSYRGRNGDEMKITGGKLGEIAARALLNLARKQV